MLFEKHQILLFLLCTLLISCTQQNNEDIIIVSVSNSYLTPETFFKLYPDISANSTKVEIDQRLNDWIESELLYQAALNLELNRDEVLSQKLVQYRRDLLGNAFLNLYFDDYLSVSTDEIREYYHANRIGFKRNSEEARIIHFVLKDESTAFDVKNSLLSYDGSIRQSLLEKYNVDIDIVSESSIIPQLKYHLFGKHIKSKGVFGPYKTDYGYHIVEILDRYLKNSYIGIDRVYDDIVHRILEQKRELLYTALIDSLKNSYGVSINKTIIDEYK